MKKPLALIILSAAMAGWVNAAVLFGNLGPTGTGSLGASFNHVLTTRPFAVGFNTSQSLLLLDSIELGLQADVGPSIPNYTIGIFSNINGEPGTLLHTSAPITVTTTIDKYSFDFGGVQLASSSTFWVVPSPNVHWFQNIAPGPAEPQAYNASGLSWAGTISQFPPDPWEAANSRLSVSLQGTEVPEPGTFLAGAILLGGAAITLVRRRRAAAA